MENNQHEKQQQENQPESIFTPDEFSMDGYDKHIRQARNAIFWAAGLLLINVIILVASFPGEIDYLWADIAIWGAFILGFVALGLWTKKKPYYAIIGALCLYAIFILLNALIDVNTLYKGIIFKIIIIVLLVKGLNDAKEAQEMRKNFER